MGAIKGGSRQGRRVSLSLLLTGVVTCHVGGCSVLFSSFQLRLCQSQRTENVAVNSLPSLLLLLLVVVLANNCT